MLKILLHVFVSFFTVLHYDFLQIISKINELHDIADQQQRCIQKSDFCDLEENDVKIIFASKKTIVFHLVEYDLAVKRAKLFINEDQEDEIAVSLNHDNIVTTYITFRQRDEYNHFQYLVMEYMNYKLAEISKMENDTKISICVSVCDALIYLHSRNIAHLDVKPSNVGATIINNHNNKKREIGLLHIYKSLETLTSSSMYPSIYDIFINNIYIKFKDPICKTNIYLLDSVISNFYETNTDEQDPIIIVNQNNDTGRDVVYKLLDFGLSRRYYENEETNRTEHGLHGTYPDIAHEIYTSATFTLKTDVFNIGSLCYQLFYEKNLNKKGKDKNYIIVDYETDEQQENRRKMQNSINDIDKIILSCIPDDPSARPELTAIKQDLLNYEQSQSLGNPLQKNYNKETIKKHYLHMQVLMPYKNKHNIK